MARVAFSFATLSLSDFFRSEADHPQGLSAMTTSWFGILSHCVTVHSIDSKINVWVGVLLCLIAQN
jgi:hypothetical protein